ncbi:MAG: glycosyltransferase family 2 protein [Patescibacteria group bacterium]
MKVSIIIPAYNEAATISQVLQAVCDATFPDTEKEIIVINDGSQDATGIIAESFITYGIRVIHFETNQGKGAAIRHGISLATGDAVVIQDADLEYDPRDIGALLATMKDTKALAVYGVRHFQPTGRGYPLYVLGNSLINAWCNLLYKTNLRDIYTCYKLVDRVALQSLPLTSNGFAIEAEITGHLLQKQITIHETPIHYHPRSFVAGKKIRLVDGLLGAITLLQVRIRKA